MDYATEIIAEALKEARNLKGISQRALSALSGVPQAHISKIEQNDVDLRLSSLLALAHALDLELALVPKKALPAVKSIVRSTSSGVRPELSKEWARTLQALQRAESMLEPVQRQSLHDGIAELARFSPAGLDTDALKVLRRSLEAIRTKSEPEAAQEAIRLARKLRNSIVHNVDQKSVTPPRPAYRLEDEDDA